MLTKTNVVYPFAGDGASGLNPVQYSMPVRGRDVLAWVPDDATVRKAYADGFFSNSRVGFPYWAKVWPAAVGLCQYLASHDSLVRGKMVLEIAAGLGLPSLVSAVTARSLLCTDIDPLAVFFARQSAALNGFANFQAMTLSWNDVPVSLQAEVVLLSDVNYGEADLPAIEQLIRRFLSAGAIVALSTPQRIAGKNFLLSLLSFAMTVMEELVTGEQGQQLISIYIFKSSSN